ncbi:L,D-transpeptidase family protein [Azospirillum halopraeferens]|uniref:L,D-transpeptidase family protein n=1 Tax=Azospirillum halopraeferens TaxID=34010 RepID=UPI000424D6C1|nr:L,D-transpeptidase family protein [Azospirillum halopraeferens]
MEITVTPDAVLAWPGGRVPCVLGRGGIRADKREGDGATPAGAFPLRRVLWRADRLERPRTALPVRPIAPDDGWCDDPADPAYNRPVRRPYPAGHEALWRDDNVYDVIVVMGHNDEPVVPGLGSAVFLHVARPDRETTAGCVALALPDLLRLLADCDTATVLRVPAP